MKKKSIIALTSLMLLGAAPAVMGDGALKITVDGERVAADLGTSSARSVKEVVESLGGFSNYDSGRLVVEKPEVNVLVLEGIQQTRSKDIVFSNPITGWLEKDIPRTFGVFVEVDDAPSAKDLYVRVKVIAPNGKVVDNGKDRVISSKNNDHFYFSQPFVSMKFDQFGTYKVQVVMKKEKNGQEVIVGENSFKIGK